MSSKRQQYRVGQRRRFMTVTLHAPGSTLVEGEIVNLSSRGTAALFDAQDVTALHKGAEFELEFHALLLTQPIRANATLRNVDHEEQGCRIGFEFLEPDVVMRQVPYVMLREFNRRSAPRVDIEERVDVELRHAGGEIRIGRIVDISVGGLCLRLRRGEADGMRSGEPWKLRFTLPERPPVVFIGSVCALRSDAAEVIVSVEFDPEATEEYELQRLEIDKFVAERLKNPPAVPGA